MQQLVAVPFKTCIACSVVVDIYNNVTAVGFCLNDCAYGELNHRIPGLKCPISKMNHEWFFFHTSYLSEQKICYEKSDKLNEKNEEINNDNSKQNNENEKIEEIAYKIDKNRLVESTAIAQSKRVKRLNTERIENNERGTKVYKAYLTLLMGVRQTNLGAWGGW